MRHHYSELVFDHFTKPRHVGYLPEQDADVITARVGEAGVTDVLQLQLRIGDEQHITDTRCKVYGNPYSVAVISYLAETLVGKTLDDLRYITYRELAKRLVMPENRVYSALLAEQVLKKIMSQTIVKQHSNSNDQQVITLTETAVQYIKKQLAKRAPSDGIYLSITTTGCSGYAYQIDYITDQVQEADSELWQQGVRIVVQQESLPYLKGSTLDYKQQGLNWQPHFDNPNAEGICGCGESFTLASSPY